ncbi:TIGR04283 family arsenosugar biosynthesis glycosyltransferase, partial [Arcticibacter svalbardensis]|uniref:TIGR04283 family arsenosugar biosynthesis glycosyltransferase n=1 Tax=Arcticibacter svalbardensis TaxID=1288027 RepID=UPI000590268F
MISIIIPVFNEEYIIANCILNIRATCATDQIEIIVVDGGSDDETFAIAQEYGANVVRGKKGRASQMNLGVAVATGELLYFLHADSLTPLHFDLAILKAIQNNAKSGCFRLAFDHKHWFLKANSWFTRFNVNAVRFGDQSLFVFKEVFYKIGGFREDLLIMEDQEIIHRLKRQGKFIVIRDYVSTSSRKYLDNGMFRMQGIFFRIWALYYLGYPQAKILKTYK